MSDPSPTPKFTKPKRRLHVFVLVVAVLAAVLVGGHAWLTSHGDEFLREELAKHGVYLSYKARSWLPWRGVRLTEATLHHDATNSHPVITFSSLDVKLPWQRIWNTHSFATFLKTYDAQVTLHDDEGSMQFDHLNAAAMVRPGEIDFIYLIAENGTLHFDVHGKILSKPAPKDEPPSEFTLSLQPLRAMCSTLNFTANSGRFSIRGQFVLDHRTENHTWNADLTGSSQRINWRGLPLESTQLQGRLSDAGMQLRADLRFRKDRPVWKPP